MVSSSGYLLKSSKEYAIYVCQQRAIPYVADGFKHVQRMALWLLRNRSEKIKTVALGGLLAFEKLYVHGDVSANDAIGLLAAPYKNNAPLIEGLGHFGSKIAQGAIGAPRYTEVRRSKAAEALLYRDLELVPMEDNYDGSNQQPVHFLPLIPIVLLNGVSGIATAWSTNILPHDLRTLIDATKAALLEKPIKPIAPCWNKYDIIVEPIGINRWELTGRAKVLDASTIEITELPPGLDIETFRKRLIAMEDEGSIQTYIDRSTESINITVKMKRRMAQLDGATPKYPHNPITQWSAKELVEFFKLRERLTERIVVVDWNGTAIRTYESPEQLIVDYARWRLAWYEKRFALLIAQDSHEIRFWLALKILFDKKFPAKLGTFPNKSALQQTVVEMLQPDMVLNDETQMDRVISLPTYRWTREFEAEVSRRIDDLQSRLTENKAIIASPDRLRDVYVSELDSLKSL